MPNALTVAEGGAESCEYTEPVVSMVKRISSLSVDPPAVVADEGAGLGKGTWDLGEEGPPSEDREARFGLGGTSDGVDGVVSTSTGVGGSDRFEPLTGGVVVPKTETPDAERDVGAREMSDMPEVCRLIDRSGDLAGMGGEGRGSCEAERSGPRGGGGDMLSPGDLRSTRGKRDVIGTSVDSRDMSCFSSSDKGAACVSASAD